MVKGQPSLLRLVLPVMPRLVEANAQSGLRATMKVLFAPTILLAAWLFPTSLAAQETDPETSERPVITLSNGDRDSMKVGAENADGGPSRHPKRTYIGDQGLVVEFSQFAPPPSTGKRSPPPLLSDLMGNPARQRALDRSARPGSWVTPPAAKR